MTKADAAAGEWLSFAQVQELARCSEPTVIRAVAAGEIRQRRELPRGVPSLERASAETWAKSWRAKQAHRPAPRKRRPQGPPDLEHVWLNTPTAALVVGVAPSWLVTLAAAGRAPHTRVGRRLWWRRDHVEIMAAARAARRVRETAHDST